MKQILACLCLLLAACGGSNNPPEPATAPANAPAANSAQPQRASEDAAKAAARAAELLVQAKAALDKAANAEAIQLLEEAAEFDPTNAEVHALLGKLYTRAGRLSEAKFAHRLAARHERDERRKLEQAYLAADASLALSLAAFTRNDFALAEQQARDSLADRPAWPRTRRALADALFHLGKTDEALPVYQQVVTETSGPDRLEALNWQGHCHLRLDDRTAAEEVFSDLIRQGYTENDVFAWRGSCRFHRKDYAGARADFLQAVKHATSDANRQQYRQILDEITAAEKG